MLKMMLNELVEKDLYPLPRLTQIVNSGEVGMVEGEEGMVEGEGEVDG